MNNIKDIALQNEARIMAFLCGEMTPEEESLLFSDMAKDPKLKADAISIARLAKGLKQVGEDNDKLLISVFKHSDSNCHGRDWKNECRYFEIADYKIVDPEMLAYETDKNEISTDTHAEPIHTSPSHKLSVWLSMAASLIIFVWLGIEYYSYRNTTSLGNEYCNAISSGMIARSAADNADIEKQLSALFANVQNGNNLDATIRELSACWSSSNNEVYNEYTNYSAEIGWYLAIAYLKDNDKTNAKAVLEELIATTEKDAVVNKKATELIKKL